MPKVFRRSRKVDGKVVKTKTYYFWLTENGARKLVATGTRDYQAARRIAQKQWEYTQRAKNPGRSSVLRELIEEYLEDRTREVSHNHHRNISGVLRQLARRYGHIAIRRLDQRTIRGFLAQKKEGRSPATYNRALQSVRTFLSWCVARGYASENCAASRFLPNLSEPEQPRSVFTREEVSCILEACKTPYAIQHRPPRGSRKRIASYTQVANAPRYLYFLIKLAVYTAMRRGELMRVLWRNVNLDDGSILIPKSKSKKVRTVYFPSAFAVELDIYRQNSRERGLPVGPNDAVFLRDTGQAVSHPSVAFRTAMRRAGIQSAPDRRLSFHSLRHTSLTELASIGTPIHIVQAIAGHSSIMTTRRYLHENEEAKKHAANRMCF